MILLTGGESMSRLFDLDWQLLADSTLMIIAIFFLFLILSYFLFNPARKMLNNRRDKIRNELNAAREAMLLCLWSLRLRIRSLDLRVIRQLVRQSQQPWRQGLWYMCHCL